MEQPKPCLMQSGPIRADSTASSKRLENHE
jgi:hypothetical protein